MPVSRYFGGHGQKILDDLIKEYGEEKGTSIFYAMVNKQKKKKNYLKGK